MFDYLIKDDIPELIHSFIKIAIKFSCAKNLVETMYKRQAVVKPVQIKRIQILRLFNKSLSDDENLSKCEESWDVLARRNLIEEEDIMKKCQETGQVAGTFDFELIFKILNA